MNKEDKFYDWMINVEGKSSTSAKKYLSGVKAILKDLYKYTNEKINIGDINTLKQSEELRKKFLNTKELVEKNKRGNNMYSVGLTNFIKFIGSYDSYNNSILESNQNLYITEKVIYKQPILNVRKRKKTAKRVIENKTQWPRDPKIIEDVLNYNFYICEVDKEHKFFVSKVTNKNYVEGHHLIPMEFQENFNYSLDTEANIMCLCPICHLILHRGLFEEKEEVIKKLYRKHNENLIKSGIEISLEELFYIYK